MRPATGRAVENIGPRERRKRLVMAAAALILAFGALAVLIVTGVGRGWRLALFLPLWFAALGWFQAREGT